MNMFEEDEEFFNTYDDSACLDEEDDEEDPKAEAFMRGVEKAVEISDDDEEFDF